jgi:stage V sporulation protein AC
LNDLYRNICGFFREDAGTLTSVTLIFIAALLSGIGWFDRIAKYAGAGTLVPITGFANSVVSPAIDSRAEGMILGVGAKIFSISGPVLLYGTLAGAVYGFLLWSIGILTAI